MQKLLHALLPIFGICVAFAEELQGKSPAADPSCSGPGQHSEPEVSRALLQRGSLQNAQNATSPALVELDMPHGSKKLEKLETPEMQRTKKTKAPQTKQQLLAQKAPLNEDGYVAIAKFRNYELMESYIRRAIHRLGLTVLNEGGFKGIVPYYSGQRSQQNYAALMRELIASAKVPGSWLVADGKDDGDNSDEGDENKASADLANLVDHPASLEQLENRTNSSLKKIGTELATMKRSSHSKSREIAQVMVHVLEDLKQEQKTLANQIEEQHKADERDAQQQKDIKSLQKDEKMFSKKFQKEMDSLEHHMTEDRKDQKKKLEQQKRQNKKLKAALRKLQKSGEDKTDGGDKKTKSKVRRKRRRSHSRRRKSE